MSLKVQCLLLEHSFPKNMIEFVRIVAFLLQIVGIARIVNFLQLFTSQIESFL